MQHCAVYTLMQHALRDYIMHNKLPVAAKQHNVLRKVRHNRKNIKFNSKVHKNECN